MFPLGDYGIVAEMLVSRISDFYSLLLKHEFIVFFFIVGIYESKYSRVDQVKFVEDSL